MDPLAGRIGSVLQGRKLIGPLVGLMGILLLLSAWRPPQGISDAFRLQAHVKRVRRTVSELPESRVTRSRRQSAERAASALLRTTRDSTSLSSEVGSTETRSKMSDERRRPRYLQACLTPPSHSTLAPPAC